MGYRVCARDLRVCDVIYFLATLNGIVFLVEHDRDSNHFSSLNHHHPRSLGMRHRLESPSLPTSISPIPQRPTFVALMVCIQCLLFYIIANALVFSRFRSGLLLGWG